ncbi:MAG: hypothetical protein AB4206_08790 [Xenococcaceae cyanobacterium]
MSQQSNSLSEKKSSLIHQPFPEHEINLFNPPKKNPNGYLSPAKLYLDGILEEQLISSTPEKNQRQNLLLNPWAISSMIIVLLANLVSATFVLLHRQEAIKVAKPLSFEQLSTGANLAAKEFIELNLSTLSTISPPEPETNKSEPTKSITEEHEGYIPTYAAHPLLSNSQDYYYILTEYAGDRSLQLAKAQVQQVSLVNFPQGIFIYLGAFEQKSQAEEFVVSLKEEGMYAYVYPFD